jgi:hypothetical protein
VTRPLVDVTVVLADGTEIPVDVVFERTRHGVWQWRVVTDLDPYRDRLAGARVDLGPMVWEQTATDLEINPP